MFITAALFIFLIKAFQCCVLWQVSAQVAPVWTTRPAGSAMHQASMEHKTKQVYTEENIPNLLNILCKQ